MSTLHIYRMQPTTTEREQAQLDGLDKYQKKYLSRRVCWLCEWPLDRKGCGTYGGMEACPEDARVERRDKCLAEYKPRPKARK